MNLRKYSFESGFNCCVLMLLFRNRVWARKPTKAEEETRKAKEPKIKAEPSP